jgi:hypothetical protein
LFVLVGVDVDRNHSFNEETVRKVFELSFAGNVCQNTVALSVGDSDEVDRWTALPTNKVVGALWPNDAEGIAYSDPGFGFPNALKAKNYRLVDPGRFESSTNDFSQQIAMFKDAKVEILTAVLPPPAFATFWHQAGQQGFKPKIATIAKAVLFPAAVEALPI